MRKRSIIVISGLVALLLGGCTPTVVTRGNLISDTQFQQLQVQKSTRADVIQAWGPPTVTSPFDENTWYYIGERTAQKGIFAPEVEQRRMVRVKFNPANNDTVVDVADIDPKLGKNVDPIGRTTPTAGKEYTFLQQMIGNVGKYNTDTTKK